MSRGYVEAEIDLDDREICIDGKLAGVMIPFEFKSKHYQICIPHFNAINSLNENPPKPTFEGTPASNNWVNRKNFVMSVHWKDIIQYGSAVNYKPRLGTTEKIIIQKFVVRSMSTVTVRQSRVIKKELRQFNSLFIEWLEVITYCDFRIQHNKDPFLDNRKIFQSSFVSEEGDVERKIITRSDEMVTLWQKNFNVLPLASLHLVLEKLKDGIPPPLYYQQLMQAVRHLNDGAYRQCIFDAATAFEVALSKKFELQISSHTEQEQKKIKKKFYQISGLIDGLEIWGGTGFDKSLAIEKVATPRNKAIHEGRLVTRANAEQAVSYTHDYIYFQLPLE